MNLPSTQNAGHLVGRSNDLLLLVIPWGSVMWRTWLSWDVSLGPQMWALFCFMSSASRTWFVIPLECNRYAVHSGYLSHSSKSVQRRQWHPTPVLLPGKSPWMEGPGGLQSMGSIGVGQDWGTSLSFFTFMHWRRKWQPTPVFFPGESQGRGGLVGCRLWGCTESDMTEAT